MPVRLKKSRQKTETEKNRENMEGNSGFQGFKFHVSLPLVLSLSIPPSRKPTLNLWEMIN